MAQKFDITLSTMVIDSEIQAGKAEQDIIQLMRDKYLEIDDRLLSKLILERKKAWIKQLLESYHSLNSWELTGVNWRRNYFNRSGYKIYRDVPDGYVLKLMLEEALSELGNEEPKLRDLLILKYINEIPATIKEIQKVFSICKQTVYNWLDRALECLAEIIVA